MRSEIITIKKETFETTTYLSISGCALATTLKELGYKVDGVGSNYVRLKGEESDVKHEFSSSDAYLIQTAYNDPKDTQITIHFIE